jgi:hypothetical protein
MTDAQRTRLLQLLGMTGSPHTGEAVNALRLAQRLMSECKIGWPDLLHYNGGAEQSLCEEIWQLKHRLDIATEAAQQLLAENNALKATLALGGRRNWTAVGDHCAQAQWTLDQHQKRTIFLRRFELDFLDTIAGWEGPLTVKQQPVFSRIIARIASEYGMRPPP